MDLVFYGKNIDHCLEQASVELNIPKDKIQYTVIKDSGLFNHTTEIRVSKDKADSKDVDDILKLLEEDSNETKINDVVSPSENISENATDLDDSFLKSDYGLSVKNGKIVINIPDSDSKNYTIQSCIGIDLIINGVSIPPNTKHTVSAKDTINCIPTVIEPQKKMDIKVSDDKMKVFATVEYTPQYTYKLKDCPVTENLILRIRKVPTGYIEKYTVSDLLNALHKLNIKQGIKTEILNEVCEGTVGAEILVAEGIPQKDDKEDEIKILFADKEKNSLEESTTEKIDYRNLTQIANVQKGEILAIKIPGVVGENGTDVFGSVVPKKTLRSKTFKATTGCTLEENHIIATKAGRPSEINGIFTVNDLYSVNDVDLTTGNINFIGDVEVSNNINDGMSVHAKGSLIVRKNITSASASANGPITIMGSVINSNILAGGYDVEKKTYVENLNKYRSNLLGLIESIKSVTERTPGKNIGEIIRVIIDKRYKNIPNLSMNILTFNISSGIQKSEILDFIRNKLMGLNTFNIKSIEEVENFKERIEEEIEVVGDQLEIPIDVTLAYSQNSNIVATGSIYVTGKGEYTSKMRAFDTIEFTGNRAVARGGILQARKALKLKTVGSEAGVITELHVEKTGIITADIAYNNTVFCFGDKKKILEVSGKSVKAYVDDTGDIIIEKFVL